MTESVQTSAHGSSHSDWSFARLKKGRAFDYVLYAISLIGFIAAWWIFSILITSPAEHAHYVVSPADTFDTFIRSFTSIPDFRDPLMPQIFASLQRFLLGFGLALVLAVPLGLAMGYSRIFEGLGKPIVEVLRPIPPIAWVPLFFVAFGVFLGPIMTIFLGAFFPILSNVMFGVKSVDPTLMDAAKTLGASKSKIFTKVVFPYTIPYMMTGVTVGLGIAWMCIVAAEMMGGSDGGVGAIINVSGVNQRYNYMFAGMLAIAILGIFTVWASKFAENKISNRMGMR